MKIVGVWFIYFLVCSAVWYLLSERDSVWHSLIFGAAVGVIGSAIYAIQHRFRRAKR